VRREANLFFDDYLIDAASNTDQSLMDTTDDEIQSNGRAFSGRASRG
jgi:hypothetical protein